MWHWIEEDGERSSPVQPLLKSKIRTLNKNNDDDDDDDDDEGSGGVCHAAIFICWLLYLPATAKKTDGKSVS